MQPGNLATIVLGITLSCSATLAAPVVVGFERFPEGTAGVSPGLLLYNELNCTACHGALAPNQASFPPRTAPNLQDVAGRILPDYLKAFIAAPQATKPGATMPHSLAGMDEAQAAEASDALTQFLLSLGGTFQDDTQPPDAETLERGNHLFHTVGCVACHAPTETPEGGASDDIFAEAIEMPEIVVPSVPLPDLAAKTSATALAAFLQNPSHARPGGRMPNMTLTEDEATAIADWLVYGKEPREERGTAVPAVIGGQQPAIDPAKVTKGRELFQSLGCAACHAVEGLAPGATAPALSSASNWTSGCLAEAPVPGTPWYDLSPAQRSALTALKDLTPAAPTPADTVSHTLAALNCYACHARNGIGGPEPGRTAYFTETEALDLGDEGRMPPALTGVGAKLTPEWLHAILTEGGRVRPYMATRMPHFPLEQVAPLAEALLEVDSDPSPLEVNVSGLEHHHRNHYGRELMGVNGLGCVTCHDLDGHRSLGIPAVDLANVPVRLQPEWFLKYLLDPATLRPQTRMPDFFDGNTSLSSKLFNSDARKQVEALWIYLKEVKMTRLPEGMEDNADYELRPNDRPIVHRTFMEGIGTHAIAVGFPGGLNYAYDALGNRPALLWRGRFIDAESAQADRFTPFVKPLGEEIVPMAEGTALASALEGPWDTPTHFRGYHLDANRVPTFRYTFGTTLVEETVQPDAEGKAMVRKTTLSGPAQTVFLRLGVGEVAPDQTQTLKMGKTTLRITNGPPPTAGPAEIGWVLPIAVTEAGTTVEQVISW